MKKSFILIILSAIFIFAGVMTVGCGKSVSNTTAYNAIEAFVIDSNSEEAPFSIGTVNGVETNYYINNFQKKNDSNVLIDDDQNYQLLNAVGLNYIGKYYSELENVQNKYDFSSLYENTKKLKTRYNELKTLNDEINGLGSNAQSFVYNGYFSKYKISAREFVDQTYSTAAALGDLLINKIKITSSLGTDNQTQEDFEKYMDYQNMMLFKDFNDFFMKSCKGQIIDNAIYTATKTKMLTFCQDIVLKTNKTLSKEKVAEVVTMSNALMGERRMYAIAAKNFSLYDFTTKYENSIDAYEKAQNDADSCYDEMQRYLTDENCSLNIYYNYLKNNVKNN